MIYTWKLKVTKCYLIQSLKRLDLPLFLWYLTVHWERIYILHSINQSSIFKTTLYVIALYPGGTKSEIEIPVLINNRDVWHIGSTVEINGELFKVCLKSRELSEQKCAALFVQDLFLVFEISTSEISVVQKTHLRYPILMSIKIYTAALVAKSDSSALIPRREKLWSGLRGRTRGS